MQTKVDTILVLDFGGQYCHLIGRRIREQSVYSEIVPHDISPEEVKALNEKFNVKGLILSGGPSRAQTAPKNFGSQPANFGFMLWSPNFGSDNTGKS
jgi:GMP synthase (glutamine-hydrolysing)